MKEKLEELHVVTETEIKFNFKDLEVKINNNVGYANKLLDYQGRWSFTLIFPACPAFNIGIGFKFSLSLELKFGVSISVKFFKLMDLILY